VVTLYNASLTFSNSTFCPHSVFMSFVWVWEQTAIISLYSINWMVFITETECVYCAVRTGSLYTASLTFSNSTFCPHSVFMCFVWIWEQTAIISRYNINWLVFITETECVYCAVWTGSLYTASLTFSNSTFCPHRVFRCFVWIWEKTTIISPYNINWLVFVTETECVYCAVRTGSLYTASLTFSNSTFCPHSVFMCFVRIWEQTAIISLHSINWLVFITETECVYCEVRTGSLYTASLTFSNSTFCPHSVFMCFVGFENKQRLFPHTTLTDWFL